MYAEQTVPQIPAEPSESIVPGARLRSLRGSWLQISVEPGDQSRHHVGLIGALEKDMALVGIDDELRLHAVAPQRIPVLVGLRDWNFRIAVAADNQSRCSYVLDERHRRAALVYLGVIVNRAAEVREHPRIYIIGAVVALPVGQSGAGDRGLETVGPGQ